MASMKDFSIGEMYSEQEIGEEMYNAHVKCCDLKCGWDGSVRELLLISEPCDPFGRLPRCPRCKGKTELV